VGIISAILFGISLLGIIFNPSILFYVLTVIFAILAIVSGAFWYQFVRNKAWLEGVFKRNKLTLSKFGLDAKTMEGVLANIQNFNEEYSRRDEELETLRANKKVWEEKINTLADKRIPELEKKIRGAEDKIDGIKGKSKEETLTGYSKKLKQKQSHDSIIEKQESILENLFGEGNKNHWEDEITSLEEY
jgi:cell division protein FtsB